MKRTKQPFNPSRPVKVYWNLHRNCYSVQQNGLVIGHTDCIALNQVSFKVSQAGRDKVLKEKRKNVHAFIIGTIATIETVAKTQVTYNPYKFSSFVERATLNPIFSAKFAKLENRGKVKVSA